MEVITVPYIQARFCGDKYKLHHQKLMRSVSGLVVSKSANPGTIIKICTKNIYNKDYFL